MNPWVEIYERHFQQYLGKPFDIQTFQGPESVSLRVATYDLAIPNFRVLASLGLSQEADRLQNVGEIALLSDVNHPDVMVLFVSALIHIVLQKIPLDTPFAVGGIEVVRPRFAEHFQKSYLFVGPPMNLPKGMETVEGWEDTGFVFQAQFISQAEYELFQRGGSSALLLKLQEQAATVDIRYLRRPSSV